MYRLNKTYNLRSCFRMSELMKKCIKTESAEHFSNCQSPNLGPSSCSCLSLNQFLLPSGTITLLLLLLLCWFSSFAPSLPPSLPWLAWQSAPHSECGAVRMYKRIDSLLLRSQSGGWPSFPPSLPLSRPRPSIRGVLSVKRRKRG